MALELASLPSMLRLDHVGPHRYAGAPEHDGDHRNVVFGARSSLR